MNGKVSTRAAIALIVGILFLFVGCQKEAPKEAPKVEKKEPAKAEPAKEVKKEEPAQEPKKEEPKPDVKKEEPPAETPKATAVDKLKAALDSMPQYDLAPGAFEKYLGALAEVEKEFPDSPEAMQAYVASARTRSDCLVLAAAGVAPDLEKRLLALDGKLGEGQEPGDEVVAGYLNELAAAMQEKAKKMDGDAQEQLNLRAGLLMVLAQERLVKAGKLPTAKLVVPAEWFLATPTPAPASADAGAPAAEGAQPEVAAAADGTAKPAEGAQPEVAAAADGTAKPAEGAQPAAEGAKPAGPASGLQAGGADVATLLSTMNSKGGAALAARILVASRLKNGLTSAAALPFAARWVQFADAAGPVLCAACGQLGTIKEEFLGDVLFLKENAGLLCAEALPDIEQGMTVAQSVIKNCASGLGLAAEDAALATPVNTLALRSYSLAAQLVAQPPEGVENDPLLPHFAPLAQALQSGLQELLPLDPVIELFPKDKWAEMKDRLVLRSDLSPLAPAWSFQPVELIVADEKGVSKALRPLARPDQGKVAMLDREAGYGWPGKLIIDVEGIAKELEEKNKALKEQKKPYDESLGAFLEDVTIRGTLFKKPDFSIPSVVEAAKKLVDEAGQFEGRAFAYLAGQSVINTERTQWPVFPETVGRAALYAIDIDTPALLFKRILDSLYYADYKDDRLVKGTGIVGSVPTVYFTEKFVDETVLDTTYKRPILVLVTEDGSVRFYPPTDITRKGKMTAKRNPRRRDIPWSGKFPSVEDPRNPDPLWNLFMAYTHAGNSKFEENVVGIAAAMKKKWDNGNVFYVVADDKASSGVVVKVADLLTRLPEDAPLAEVGKAYPGITCDPEKAAGQCISNIVVLFPDVEIPYLPGKKKVKEAETSVYCDQKDIEAKINAKRGAIKFCYDPELQKNPQLQGKVVFKFTIGPEGRVTSISLEQDGLGNTKVTDCTRNIIKGITFRRPIGGECVIRYPWNFKP
ncbi:MAG: AgmX/PglI C-terminal domain-containing protein [Deltaproteobacteria bacterium]|nr:AgmX/PglI C-terminal domain-containing protein [Deltaproteobacteria bacterium]